MKTINFLAPFERFVDRKLEQTPPARLYPILLGALILLGFLPLLFPGLPHGHDSLYHISRIVSLGENIRHGFFFPFLDFDALEGYGYGYGLFYSDLYLYPFGLLAAAGLPALFLYKLFLVIWGVLTAFSMYWVAKRISGDAFAGFAAALLYCWSSYHACDMIIRAAIGEYMAFLFIPWCMYGLWTILYEDRDKYSCLPLALGYAGLFYCHNISFVLTCIVGGLLIVFKSPALLRDSRRLSALISSGLLALGLAAFGWIPLVQQLQGLKFNLNARTVHYPIADRMVPFLRLFLELPYMKMEYWIPPGIGIIFVIVYFQRFRIKSNWTPAERFRDVCMIIGFVSLLAASEFLPWQGMMSVIAAIQFPWRFYLLATAFGALGGGLLMGKLLADRPVATRRVWILILICGCGFPWWFLHCYHYAAKISEHAIIHTFTRENATRFIISGILFIPPGKVDADYIGLGGKAPVTSDNPEAATVVSYPAWGKLEIDYSGFSPGDAFEIPRVYYIGYHVETEQGGVIDLSEQEHFRFRPNASSGKVVVVYRPTNLHKLSFVISFLAATGLVLYVAFPYWKQFRKRV